MPNIVPRFYWNNLFVASASILTASSEASAHPLSRLRDPLLTRRWRSQLGWNIVAGVNDDLDFKEAASTELATLAEGNYPTAQLIAAEVKSKMEAAGASANTYDVTYDFNTRKPTIARATGSDAIELLWNTGANKATSIAGDIGFDDSADDTGATTYTADNPSRHSREWVKADLSSAMAFLAGFFTGHNVTSTGVVTLQGNATDAFAAPSFSQALSGTGSLRAAGFSSTSLQYWRFLIDDIDNEDGYVEAGVVFGGEYDQPARHARLGYSEAPDDLSIVVETGEGAIFQTKKDSRNRWPLEFPALTVTEKTDLRTMLDDRGVGGAFFFSFDPDNDLSGSTHYVALSNSASFQQVPRTNVATASARLWHTSLSLQELIQ